MLKWGIQTHWMPLLVLIVQFVCASGSLADGDPPRCSEPLVGSWRHVVHESNRYAGGGYVGRIDPIATVDAAVATGQNVLVFDIDRTEQWRVFDELLEHAERKGVMVYAAVDKIRSPEADGEEWLPPSGSKTVWLGSKPPKIGDDDAPMFDIPSYAAIPEDEDFYEDERAYLDEYLACYRRIAKRLSQISSRYPALRGMVINDMEESLATAARPACVFGRRLTRDDLADIRKAAKGPNPDFELWTVIYPPSFGALLADGHVLGAERGVRFRRGERARVELAFGLPASELPVGSSATLEFFHGDQSEEEEGEDCSGDARMNRRVELDDALLTDSAGLFDYWPMPISDVQGLRLERFSLGRLAPGKRTIGFELSALHPCKPDALDIYNGCGSPFWYIWGVRVVIKRPGGSTLIIDEFDAKYIVDASSSEYTPKPDCVQPENPSTWGDRLTNETPRCSEADPPLPDDDTAGRLAHQIIAGPTGDWSIRESVDGVIAGFYPQDVDGEDKCRNYPKGCPGFDADAAKEVVIDLTGFAYDDEVFERTIDATLEALDGAGLMPILLAGPQSVESLDVLERQIAVSSSAATATLLWTMPVGVHHLGDRRGVFADHSPLPGTDAKMTWNKDGVDTVPVHLVLAWPGHQPTLTGWYQQWTIDPWEVTDEVTIRVRDNVGTDVEKPAFTFSVAGPEWVAPTGDPLGLLSGWLSLVVSEPFPLVRHRETLPELGHETFVISEGTTGLVSFGAGPIVVRLELTGEVGDRNIWVGISLDGFELDDPAISVDFDTGVSPRTQEIYDSELAALFAARPIDADLNGDGLRNFTDYFRFLSWHSLHDDRADLDYDGRWTIDDRRLFEEAIRRGCP